MVCEQQGCSLSNTTSGWTNDKNIVRALNYSCLVPTCLADLLSPNWSGTFIYEGVVDGIVSGGFS